MHPYIHVGNLVFESYTVVNNLGTVTGLLAMYLILAAKCREEKHYWKLIPFTLAVMVCGAVPAHYLRSFFGGAGPDATHFLGRVLVYALLLPVFMHMTWHSVETAAFAWNSAAAYILIQHVFNRTACLLNGCCGGRYIPAFRADFPTRGFEALLMLACLIWLVRSICKGKNMIYFFTVCLWFSVVIFISEIFAGQPDIGRVLHMTSVQYAALLLTAISVTGNRLRSAEKVRKGIKSSMGGK